MISAAPVLVLSHNIKRENGRKVQLENIGAGKTIADVIRTCLGPQAMLKMLMDPMGGVVMTNDGNAILREITVQHPAAKTIIEVARTQDEEVGDGTTSVIVLAGEILAGAEPFLSQQMHPTVIIRALHRALEDIKTILPTLGKPIDVTDRSKVIEVVKTCIGTKFIGGWSDMACKIAIDAVSTVKNIKKGHQTMDIKNFARIEKIPGGIVEDSYVLEGVMFSKDVTHQKMSRYIKNPKVLLLDCPLEYKKGESQTNIEIIDENDFTRFLQIEEEYIQKLCSAIISLKPDVVCTEKGISDLAQHYFVRAGITALRRVRKTDNHRIALAVGATVVGRIDELKQENIGTGAALFEVKKIGDEYFSFFTGCTNPKACTILLRGPSKDILKEAERNIQDALNIVRNIYLTPVILPGAGATEMALSEALKKKSSEENHIEGDEAYMAVAEALKIIPRTLIQNSGETIVRTLSTLEVFHAKGEMYGVNGVTGKLVKSEELGIWEPLLVKQQVYKAAIEAAILLLKIDGIVSGAKNKDRDAPVKQPTAKPTDESLKE